MVLQKLTALTDVALIHAKNSMTQLLYSEDSVTNGLSVNDILNNETVTSAMADGGELSEASDKVGGILGGGYHIVFGAGILLAIIGIVLTGIGFIFAGAQKRAEQKDGLAWKIVGIVLIVGAIPILVFSESIGKGLF